MEKCSKLDKITVEKRFFGSFDRSSYICKKGTKPIAKNSTKKIVLILAKTENLDMRKIVPIFATRKNTDIFYKNI